MKLSDLITFPSMIPQSMPNLNLNEAHAEIKNVASNKSNQIYSSVMYYFNWVFYIVFFYFFFIFLIALIIMVILIRARNKMAHPYWYNQPVNYITILNPYYSFPSFTSYGVIRTTKPELDKWTNYNKIKFIPILEMNPNMKQKILEFIQQNYKYTQYDSFNYHPEERHVITYLKSHNYPAYLGCYFDKNDKGAEEICGTISAHPLNIDLYRKNRTLIKIHKDNTYENIVYYTENVCADFNRRNTGITPTMMSTMIHRVRHTSNVSMISIFKRENTKDVTPFIVPLVRYPIHVYKIENWFHKSFELHAACKLLEVSPQNIHLMYAFLHNNKSKYFDAYIYPDMTNVIELLKNESIFITMVMMGDEICSIYFFKDGATSYNGKTTIECIGSINVNQTMQFFVQGFYVSLETLVKKHKFQVLHMENLSHNVKLTKLIMRMNTPFIENESSWFFYNFCFREMVPKKVFILN